MSAVTGVYQSLDKLAEFLGFDTVQALQSWMGEKLCKPYWDEYTRGCAEVELFRGKKARLADCRSVLRHLAEGEAGGNRKFSSDFPDTPSWKFIDWQARLLYKIRSVNQADRHGIFFGKNMNEIEMATRAWQVILRLNLDASREQRPNKRVRATGEFDHWRTEDNEAIPTPVNPNGGAACVVWTDIPTEMEDNGKKTMITLTGLVRYTYEQFLEEIRNGLQLKECGYEIDELSVAGDPIASDTFEEFLKIAGGSKRKVVVDLTTKNCPVGLDIPTIENEEDTSRRLLFDIMVAEKVTSGFDLKNRFCKWSLIQEVTRSFPSRIKSEWELLTGGIDSRGDSIRVSKSDTRTYSPSLLIHCSGYIHPKTPTNSREKLEMDSYCVSQQRRTFNDTVSRKSGLTTKICSVRVILKLVEPLGSQIRIYPVYQECWSVPSSNFGSLWL